VHTRRNLVTPVIPLIDEVSSITVWAKLESINPTGSIKDRIAFFILEDAIKRNELVSGMPIIEASSGNTAVSLAYATYKPGFRFIAVVPPSTARVKIDAIRNYGGEVVVVGNDSSGISPLDFSEVIETAKRLSSELNGYMPDQFSNPLNVRAHYLTTGSELIAQMEDRIDVFVSGYGTGGTLMGVAQRLWEKDDDIEIVAVEPENSALLNGRTQKTHRIHGLADGFIPSIIDRSLITRAEVVSDEEAYRTAHIIFQRWGLLVGPSSGANVAVARRVAKAMGKRARVVTVLPDSGINYLGDEHYQRYFKKLIYSIETVESLCCV
jgi:cysteine synthase A